MSKFERLPANFYIFKSRKRSSSKTSIGLLQPAEIRMVRWICGMKLQNRIPSEGLRDWIR